MSEVFAVRRADFFGGHWPQGFSRIEAPEAFFREAASRGCFLPRLAAEEDPEWKQWIPYCVLRCGDWTSAGDGAERGVLVVQRTRAQSESRLHGSWSIGLGGHIERVDAPAEGAKFFERALRRELLEELDSGEDLPDARLFGMINDDSTPVGRVHAGLAFVIDVGPSLASARRLVGIREISKMQGGFAHLVELRDLWQTPAQFESWSQFLIRAGIAGAMGVDDSPVPS